MRGKLISTLVVGVAIIAVLLGVRAYIRHGEIQLMEYKTARTTTGVVTDKKHVQFASNETAYRDDEGKTIRLEDWREKNGEFRIFYKINNFDQMPEAQRSTIMTAEEERGRQYGPRFRIVDQRTFDQAKSGQTVTITYRWAGDSKIEIISFELGG